MADSPTQYNAAQTAVVLLNDYRHRRQGFHAFDDYDKAMEQTRQHASGKIDPLNEPLKSIALRLFAVTDRGYFLVQVCKWKLDYIAEALIHSIEAENPIALANNARALVEHLAALVATVKELEKLAERLQGQGQERSIYQALEKTEIFIKRAYYGKSPKVVSELREQAFHVNDFLKVLRGEVEDIDEVYDFLCEYVHPNHGSNALVSTGQLASGRLNPPEEFHRETLDRMRSYCSHCMLYLRDREIEHGSIFIKLLNLIGLCSVRGVTVNNVFASRAPIPDGDGQSKETAYYFRKARTAGEAIELCYEFMKEKGYEVQRKEVGGIGDGVIYDVFDTDNGKIWFKVPMS